MSLEKEGDLSILMSDGNQCNASFESLVKDELSDNEDSTVSALLNYQQNQSTNNSSTGGAEGCMFGIRMQRPIVKMGR